MLCRCAITAITESGSAKKGTNKALVTVVTAPSSVSIEGVESSLVLTYPEDGQRQVHWQRTRTNTWEACQALLAQETVSVLS